MCISKSVLPVCSVRYQNVGSSTCNGNRCYLLVFRQRAIQTPVCTSIIMSSLLLTSTFPHEHASLPCGVSKSISARSKGVESRTKKTGKPNDQAAPATLLCIILANCSIPSAIPPPAHNFTHLTALALTHARVLTEVFGRS